MLVCVRPGSVVLWNDLPCLAVVCPVRVPGLTWCMPVAAGAQCELPRSSSSSSYGECHPCACVSGVACALQCSAGELPVPCSALQLVAVWRQ